MDESSCSRCGRPVPEGETRCLAHGRRRSALRFLGMEVTAHPRGPRLAAVSAPQGPPPHSAGLSPETVLELARASVTDFEASVLDGEVVFDPGPVPRLRWRRGFGLDWLDARGFVERRVLSGRFPVHALVPRAHAIHPRPDIGSPFFRQLLERAEARGRDCRAFFGELWPEVEAALRG